MARYDVMYNDFLIAGPHSDPAGIAGGICAEGFLSAYSHLCAVTGGNCDEDMDECVSIPCLHDSTCMSSTGRVPGGNDVPIDAYRCMCVDGYADGVCFDMSAEAVTNVNYFAECRHKITKNKFKFNIKKKIIYSLSIFGFVVILGLVLFFISQSKKNESTITNKSILLEKKILIF